MAVERQSSTLPPAQPSYILRGHASQIHSVQFVRQNTRLITGDADGWVIYWKLETKRALAVWKAHDGSILGTAQWGRDKIITHGRDNSLRIWQIRAADESALSTALPADVASGDRPMPWLLHTLPVNTLNFCAFSMCYASMQTGGEGALCIRDSLKSTAGAILVAVPARDDKKAEVYQFPDERLRYMVPRAQSKDTGMVMAVKLVQDPIKQRTLVITGYEGGVTAVYLLPEDDASAIGVAQLVYLSQPHTQPILSLDVSPDTRIYFTSGADAIIAAHQIPGLLSAGEDTHQTPLSTQDLVADSPISIRTQSSGSMPQAIPDVTAVESSHVAQADDPPISVPDDDTNSPLSFSKRPVPAPDSQTRSSSNIGGLSSLLSTISPHEKVADSARTSHAPPTPTNQSPYKVINTKHAGQQSLAVRSDCRLLATGGWDSRVRIYSVKTLKEVAVLKWHKEGVYAVAFGEILEAEDLRHGAGAGAGKDKEMIEDAAKTETGLSKLQRQREEKMQVKHWVAAGAKDGKVSLWEVF